MAERMPARKLRESSFRDRFPDCLLEHRFVEVKSPFGVVTCPGDSTSVDSYILNRA